jgi:hypothetical protein
MAEHIWIDTGFSASATDIVIAFDGTMPKDTGGRVEFVTEALPWVFWIDVGGILYGQKLGISYSTVLALQNATSVSAVRSDVVGGRRFRFRAGGVLSSGRGHILPSAH